MIFLHIVHYKIIKAITTTNATSDDIANNSDDKLMSSSVGFQGLQIQMDDRLLCCVLCLYVVSFSWVGHSDPWS